MGSFWEVAIFFRKQKGFLHVSTQKGLSCRLIDGWLPFFTNKKINSENTWTPCWWFQPIWKNESTRIISPTKGMNKESFKPPRKPLRSPRIDKKLPHFGPKWLNFDAAACKNDRVHGGFLKLNTTWSERQLIVQNFKSSSFRKMEVILSFLFLAIILVQRFRGAKQDLLIFKPHALRFYKLPKHPGTLATASCFEYMMTECLHIRRPFVSRAQNSTSPNSELWEVDGCGLNECATSSIFNGRNEGNMKT